MISFAGPTVILGAALFLYAAHRDWALTALGVVMALLGVVMAVRGI